MKQKEHVKPEQGLRQVRRYVYERLWRMLEVDLRDRGDHGEILGDILHESDRKRAREVAKKIVLEIRRKARR